MEPWRTAISTSDETHMWMCGYDVTELMTRATFADVVFLLHKNRLATEGERRLVDAILVASADHGPASPSAAAARTRKAVLAWAGTRNGVAQPAAAQP